MEKHMSRFSNYSEISKFSQPDQRPVRVEYRIPDKVEMG